MKYVFFSVLIYCVAFFVLEAFSFFDWQILLINIAGSTLLTTLFIVATPPMTNLRISKLLEVLIMHLV
jgi:fluoride ion exporter CrcB/FEX